MRRRCRPAEALVRWHGREVVVRADALRMGDLVIVRPAERLPADGQVVGCVSRIDQSRITGESIPVEMAPGSRMFAGIINRRGSLEVQRAPEDSTLACITALVEHAQSAQAPAQRMIDRLGQGCAIAVIGAAALTCTVLGGLGVPAGTALYRVLILVVASPCAVVLSAPATTLSAVANGARHSVLFKGGAHLERLAGVEAVVFDQTGTLTAGRPVVTAIVPLGGDEARLLAAATALEQRSEHVLAGTVVEVCRARASSNRLRSPSCRKRRSGSRSAAERSWRACAVTGRLRSLPPATRLLGILAVADAARLRAPQPAGRSGRSGSNVS